MEIYLKFSLSETKFFDELLMPIFGDSEGTGNMNIEL